MATIISIRPIMDTGINFEGVLSTHYPDLQIIVTTGAANPLLQSPPATPLQVIPAGMYVSPGEVASVRSPAKRWRTPVFSVVIPTADDGTPKLDGSSYGRDFFEHIHTFPRTESVGTVLNEYTNDFEIHNAQRNTAETVSTVLVTGQGSDDVEVRLTATGQLVDDIVPLNMFALRTHSFTYALPAQGPALIAHSLQPLVTSLKETQDLSVFGRRAVVFPFLPQRGVQESIEFNTNVLMSKSGQESRTSERTTARQSFEMQYLLDSVDPREYQRAQALISGLAGNKVGVGLWHMASKTTSLTPFNSSTVEIDQDTDLMDIRDSGYAMLWSSWDQNEVISVVSTSGNTITLSSPISAAWPAGTYVCPVQLCTSRNAVEIERQRNNVSSIQVNWESASLTTSLADITSTYPELYRDRPVVDDQQFMAGTTIDEPLNLGVKTIDSDSGNQTFIVDTGVAVSTSKVWHADTRQETTDLRGLAYGLRGKQKSFWMPSHRDDMTIVASQNLGAGDTTFKIDPAARYASSLDLSTEGPYNNLRITLNDGTTMYRQIESVVANGAGEEIVTLTSAFGSEFLSADVDQICFLYELRQSSDTFTITHEGQGYSSASAGLIGVRKS